MVFLVNQVKTRLYSHAPLRHEVEDLRHRWVWSTNSCNTKKSVYLTLLFLLFKILIFRSALIVWYSSKFCYGFVNTLWENSVFFVSNNSFLLTKNLICLYLCCGVFFRLFRLRRYALDWLSEEGLIRVMMGDKGQVVCTLTIQSGYPAIGSEVRLTAVEGLQEQVSLESFKVCRNRKW